MFALPDDSRSFDFENGFYLTCDSSRMAKALAHYELYKMSLDAPGAIVECGVFKGASLSRFAIMRKLLARDKLQPIIGFDIFGEFPDAGYAPDKEVLKRFLDDAGSAGIALEDMQTALERRGLADNVQLIAGDITKTVPEFARKNPDFRIAFLNLDTDIYEPAVTILEELYPRISPGGLLLLDNYGVFPGETKAVDTYFAGRNITIRKLPFAATPSFIVKEGQ